MPNTLAVIDTQEYHTPLAGPSPLALATRRFAGSQLIQWLVRRVSESQHVDEVAVITGSEENAGLLRHCIAPDISVYGVDGHDPLNCFAKLISRFKAQSIVRIDITTPFVDPALIDRLATTAERNQKADYVGFCSRDGRPAVQSRVGVLAEWCRAEAILKADVVANQHGDRQHPTRFVFSHPEIFQLRLIPIPEPLDREDLRLKVDLEEDWDRANEIYDALGPECLDWQRITGLLDQQPAIRHRMATLNEAAKATT